MPEPANTFLQRAGGRRRNYDDTPLVVGEYSVDQIKAMNRRHDENMGWSPQFMSVYLNPRRLPESYFGPAETLWCRTEND